MIKKLLNHAEFRHSTKEDETPLNPIKHTANKYEMYFEVANLKLGRKATFIGFIRVSE